MQDSTISSPRHPLKLYLVRHGETEWAANGRHTGRTDIPLTARGEEEVRHWGHRLCSIPFTHVLCSPRQRARRTCELVGLGETAATEPDLAEWDYGDYEGLRSAEIRQLQPHWKIYRDGAPHGESPAEISARADRLLAHLRQKTGNIALFSHGHFGSVLAARWLGMSISEAEHFTLGTASLSILAYNPHHPEVPILELWNSAPHEAALPMPSANPQSCHENGKA
jgi:broad specificity phosphatase PhoE